MSVDALSTTVHGARRTSRVRTIVGRAVVHVCLVAFGALFLLPFYWLVSTSLKLPEEMFVQPIVWIPSTITFDHYRYGFQAVPFGRFIGNTLVVAGLSTLGAVVSCSMVAYGLARIRWPLRTPLFAIILGTMMIPFQVRMIPLFLIFKQLGWLDTFLPLIVPAFLGNAFFVFLLRQFFMTIPMELSEAAKIDGASEWRIFSSIILPLARPALATVALFQFINAWEDLNGPLIYLNDKNLYTVSIGLALFRGEYSSEFGPLMAASTVVILPIVVLFFLTQRTFIQGITLTGIKG